MKFEKTTLTPLFFAIHIADPTEYIDLNSNLWNDIVNRTFRWFYIIN